MALKSALEDFDNGTLGAIPEVLGKLLYLAEVHDGRGSYSHWGMSRVHGAEAARRAMRIAHVTILTRVLRTPLRELMEDLNRAAATRALTALEFLSWLDAKARNALPMGSPAGTEKHFMAALHALSALAEYQARANQPDGSPPLPPDQ